MTLASTYSDSLATRGSMEFVLSSATSKKSEARQGSCFGQWYDRSARVVSFDTGWGGIDAENFPLISEIVQSSEGTGGSWCGLASIGCVYANTVTYGLLNQSDVDTVLRGVLHAEEFDPQEFHDLGEQQALLPAPLPVVEAAEFIPARLISFSESLLELVYSEAKRFGVSVLGYEWSVFSDPQDLGKELVLGVTINAASDRALEFWDKVDEEVSARKQLLSLADQNTLSDHFSIQIYWP